MASDSWFKITVVSVVVPFVSVGGAILTAHWTVRGNANVATEQIESVERKARQDRRMGAYAELYSSLVAKREALLAMRCADEIPDSEVTDGQQLILNAAYKDADDNWERTWSKTELYASRALRWSIRDMKSIEPVHSGGGGAGINIRDKTEQGYAECEAMTLKTFGPSVDQIRSVIQEELDMTKS